MTEINGTNNVSGVNNTKPGSAFIKFCTDAHLQYLLLALLLYAIKALLYFAIAGIPTTVHVFNMEIDKHIPFCKYMYVFYFSYYILPEIMLWRLSFYDKRKFFNLFFAIIMANIICCICFILYQVKMIRQPGYPMDITLADIKSVSDLFDYAVSFQYKADSTALNCFPSLHAVMGMAVVLLGLRLRRNEGDFPLWCRILCVVFGAGIVVSTVMIKQHYFIDSVAGCVLLVITFVISGIILKKCMEGNTRFAKLLRDK